MQFNSSVSYLTHSHKHTHKRKYNSKMVISSKLKIFKRFSPLSLPHTPCLYFHRCCRCVKNYLRKKIYESSPSFQCIYFSFSRHLRITLFLWKFSSFSKKNYHLIHSPPKPQEKKNITFVQAHESSSSLNLYKRSIFIIFLFYNISTFERKECYILMIG